MAAKTPLLVLVGPTAVGKTALSLSLARAFGAEIISADSRLFYRGMDIGTAKPTLTERAQVPHHLIDVAEPDETWSLALFQERAAAAVQAVADRGNLPILVGGTGQYVRAVTRGWLPPGLPPDPRLRAALEAEAARISPAGLHAWLQRLDPPAARIIDYRNLRRTVRALEVILTTGRRFSEQRGQTESPYDLLQIGLTMPRPQLYARIDARIDRMLADGLVEEVRGLLARYPADLPAFSAIGYRQIMDALQGKTSLEEAVAQIRRLTRIFVRRQANWFSLNDPQIHWFQADPVGEPEITTFIRNWLESRE